MCKFPNNRVLLCAAAMLLLICHYLFIRDLCIDIFVLLFGVIAIFTIVNVFPAEENKTMLANIGKKYSLYIYIFHVLVMTFVDFAFCKIGSPYTLWYSWFSPIIVFFLTLGLVFLLNKLNVIKL